MKCINKMRKVLVLTVGVVFLAACSDGSASKAPLNLDEGDPIPVLINAFTVADASDANAEADETATIESGGSVMVAWDVSNARKIEITDSKGNQLSNVVGLVSATQSDPLTADETLTLTAEGSDGVKAQATATITIRKKELKIISFKANPENTKLCWTITDPTAKVIVKAGDAEIYPGNAVPEVTADDQQPVTVSTVTKAMRFLMKVDVPEAPEADTSDADTTTEEDTPKTDDTVAEGQEVCPVTISPTQTTTYTLSIMDGDTVVASQEVIVKVASAPANIAAFVAQPAQLSGPGEVTLTWRVTPSDVTVSIDHGVTTNGKAEGETHVQVSDTTTFTLTATTTDGQIQTKNVTVTVPTAAERHVVAKVLTPSIFAGETAQIAITHGNASGKVSVVDGSGNTPAFTVKADVVSISNPPVGSNSYTLDINGERSNTVTVEVRALETKTTGSLNGVALNGLKVAFVGGSSDSPDGIGMARMLSMNDLALVSPAFKNKDDASVKYGAKLGETMGIHADYLNNFKPFTIQSFAFSPKSDRVYAAMTGGVAFSDNAGSSWKLLDPMPLYDNGGKYKNAEESHPGCFGVTRKGARNVGGEGAVNPLVNFVEVCDVLVVPNADGSEGLIVATDFGPFTYSNVDARIKDVTVKKYAMQGATKENVLFRKVINKLATAKAGDQTLIVAAASDGVYVNAMNGDPKSWQQIDKDGLKDAVNTVVVSGNSIYAGTAKGLFKSNGLDASSTFTQVTIATDPVAVKALAVDAADSATIYVGTSSGLKLSRDCGATFTDVTVEVGEVRNIATSADSGRSAVVLTSDKGLFTSVGVAGSQGSCVVPVVAGQTTNDSSDKPATDQPPPAADGPGTVVP